MTPFDGLRARGRSRSLSLSLTRSLSLSKRPAIHRKDF